MRKISIATLLTLLATVQPARSFSVYDGLLFSNKPDLSSYGLRPCEIAYAQYLWPDANRDQPNLNYIRTKYIPELRTSSADLHIVDIEHWPVNINSVSEAEVSATIDKLQSIMVLFRQQVPNMKHGLYASLPVQDYWSPVQDDRTKLAAWYDGNVRLKPLADYVDVIFPSLYTFYDGKQGWVTYAKANIAEARRYGKPVIPFIWPQYHDSNPTLHGQLIDGSYWRLQLETLYRYADGVVIWGGWQVQWDPSAAWWIETIKFIASAQVTSP